MGAPIYARVPYDAAPGGLTLSEYESLAKNVIKKSLQVKPNENVIVESWNHGADAAREFVYQLRAAGARPMFLFEDEETYWRSVESLPPTKLGQVSRSEWAALDAADAYVFLPGPADIVRMRRNQPKYSASTAYNSDWYRRARKAGLRGARVLLGYVSPERAASYGFDYAAWRQMVVQAGSADFTAVARKGKKVAAVLTSDEEVTITSPNGTNLAFRLRGKEARADDGIVDAADMKAGEFLTNVPPGYAYVVPHETSAEGVLVADLPMPYLGRLIKGIRVTFKDGKATWAASENADALMPGWEKAEGPKDRLGYLQIGLNDAARTGFLQDDLVAGTVEVGVGDNEEAGGKNKTDFYLAARLARATVKIGRKTLVNDGRLAV